MKTLREAYEPVIDNYIKDNKKYILTERIVDRNTLLERKMLPSFHQSQVEEGLVKVAETHLGTKYKNGDKILIAFLEDKEANKNTAFEDYSIKLITFLEEEFDFYELYIYNENNTLDSNNFALHTLSLK